MAKSISAPCGATITAPTATELGMRYSAHVSNCRKCKGK